jgi:hypothetical protein
MAITQEQADKIVQNIKDDLRDTFGDIENIDLIKAIEIAQYCKNKYLMYNTKNTPVEYGYWFHMARSYDKAVNASLMTFKLP